MPLLLGYILECFFINMYNLEIIIRDYMFITKNMTKYFSDYLFNNEI